MVCSMRAGETSLMTCAIAGSRPVLLCVLPFSSADRAGGRAPDLRALVWATVADGINIRRAIAAAMPRLEGIFRVNLVWTGPALVCRLSVRCWRTECGVL